MSTPESKLFPELEAFTGNPVNNPFAAANNLFVPLVDRLANKPAVVTDVVDPNGDDSSQFAQNLKEFREKLKLNKRPAIFQTVEKPAHGTKLPENNSGDIPSSTSRTTRTTVVFNNPLGATTAAALLEAAKVSPLPPSNSTFTLFDEAALASIQTQATSPSKSEKNACAGDDREKEEENKIDAERASQKYLTELGFKNPEDNTFECLQDDQIKINFLYKKGERVILVTSGVWDPNKENKEIVRTTNSSNCVGVELLAEIDKVELGHNVNLDELGLHWVFILLSATATIVKRHTETIMPFLNEQNFCPLPIPFPSAKLDSYFKSDFLPPTKDCLYVLLGIKLDPELPEGFIFRNGFVKIVSVRLLTLAQYCDLEKYERNGGIIKDWVEKLIEDEKHSIRDQRHHKSSQILDLNPSLTFGEWSEKYYLKHLPAPTQSTASQTASTTASAAFPKGTPPAAAAEPITAAATTAAAAEPTTAAAAIATLNTSIQGLKIENERRRPKIIPRTLITKTPGENKSSTHKRKLEIGNELEIDNEEVNEGAVTTESTGNTERNTGKRSKHSQSIRTAPAPSNFHFLPSFNAASATTATSIPATAARQNFVLETVASPAALPTEAPPESAKSDNPYSFDFPEYSGKSLVL